MFAKPGRFCCRWSDRNVYIAPGWAIFEQWGDRWPQSLRRDGPTRATRQLRLEAGHDRQRQAAREALRAHRWRRLAARGAAHRLQGLALQVPPERQAREGHDRGLPLLQHQDRARQARGVAGSGRPRREPGAPSRPSPRRASKPSRARCRSRSSRSTGSTRPCSTGPRATVRRSFGGWTPTSTRRSATSRSATSSRQTCSLSSRSAPRRR